MNPAPVAATRMKHAMIVLRGTWPMNNPRDPNLEEMDDSTLLPTDSTQEDMILLFRFAMIGFS